MERREEGRKREKERETYHDGDNIGKIKLQGKVSHKREHKKIKKKNKNKKEKKTKRLPIEQGKARRESKKERGKDLWKK